MSAPKLVLLVEDNESDELLTIRAFRYSGIPSEIVVVRDGVEALEWLRGTGAHVGRDPKTVPALILLDLHLPKIDGFEVLREVRHDPATSLVPVVVLSSSRQDEDVRLSYSLGANAYVRKPIDFAEFAGAARTLGLFWLLLNEIPPTAEG